MPTDLLPAKSELRDDLCVPLIRCGHQDGILLVLADLSPGPCSLIRSHSRKAEAEFAMESSDIVRDEDSDVDGEEGGSSGEE